MKGACFALFLATALALSSGLEDVARPEYDRAGVEDLIRSVIEELRAQLKEGIPDKNIPPLDPLDIKHQDIFLGFDDVFRLNGSVSDVSGSNLMSFNITTLKAKITPIYLETKFEWSPIDVKGHYDIDGHLLNIIPIYGNGTFAGYFEGVYLYLKLEIGTKAAELRLKKFDIDFGIKNVSVSIENFLNGLLGDVICEIINENLPTMVEQFKIGYLPAIKDIVIKEVNKILEGMTMDELLDFIFGFLTSTTSAPTSTTAATLTN